MKWIRSALDLATDVAASVLLSVGALIDDWRNER